MLFKLPAGQGDDLSKLTDLYLSIFIGINLSTYMCMCICIYTYPFGCCNKHLFECPRIYAYIYTCIYIYGFRIPIPRTDSLHIETGPWFQGTSVYCGPINIGLNNMLWQHKCFHRAPYQSQSAEHTGCLYGHLNQSCISYCVCISKPHKMNTQSIRNIFLILFPCDFQKKWDVTGIMTKIYVS